MHRQRGVFLSGHVDNIKMGEKDMRSKPHMERLMTQIDTLEQTHVSG